MKLLIEMLFAFHFLPHLLQKNLKKFFNTLTNVKLFISTASNTCSKSMDFFQML